eukprot:c24313_g1_i1.p1 GENE.c24313_g1_i1~~c24313_g1_i1.p1  ORF type:complete len:381 (-),score=114.70 c24313_g1_i1:96-1238(-)
MKLLFILLFIFSSSISIVFSQNCTCIHAHSECVGTIWSRNSIEWCPPNDIYDRDYCCSTFDNCCEVNIKNTVGIASAIFAFFVFLIIWIGYCCGCCPPYFQPPILVSENKFCTVNCEESDFCKSIAQHGDYECDVKHRAKVMILCSALSAAAFILLLVVLNSWSADLSDIRHTYFQENKAYGDVFDVSVYLGLSGMLKCEKSELEVANCEVIQWDSSICPSFGSNTTISGSPWSQCDQCAQATTAVFTLSTISLLSSMVLTYLALHRITYRGDLNCVKSYGLVLSVILFACSFSSIFTFEEQCSANFPTETILLSKIVPLTRVKLGSSYICLIVLTLISPIIIFLHWIVPTPAPRHITGYRLVDVEAKFLRTRINQKEST